MLRKEDEIKALIKLAEFFRVPYGTIRWGRGPGPGKWGYILVRGDTEMYLGNSLGRAFEGIQRLRRG